MAVANQQLTLSTSDRDHGIDRLDAGVHWLGYRLPRDDARRDPLDGQSLVGVDRSLVVDGLAERIDHAANQGIADRHRHDLAGALDLLAFTQLGVVAQQHRADLVFIQVHGQAGHAMGKLDQLARHDLVQPMDARNAVAQGDDRADFVHLHALVVVFNLLPEQLGNLVCANRRHQCLLSTLVASSVRHRGPWLLFKD